jgi:hypothetical protein
VQGTEGPAGYLMAPEPIYLTSLDPAGRVVWSVLL